MDSKKLFVIVLLAAVAIQAANAASVSASGSTSVQISLPTILNKLRYTIGNLTKMASTTLNTNINKLGKIAKNISKIENEYLNGATKVANQVIYQFINLTNPFTSALGFPITNVSKCINTTQCANTMRSTFLGNVTKCIKNVSNTTSKIVNTHINILKNFSSLINKLSYNVSSCIKSSKPAACASNLLNNLTKMAQNIPKQVYDYTTQDVKRVTFLPAEMAICHMQTTLIVQQTAAQLGMKNLNCIIATLQNKTGSASGSISVNGTISGNGSVNVSGSASASAGSASTTTTIPSTTASTSTTSTTTPTTSTSTTSTSTTSTPTTSTTTSTTTASASTTTVQSG